MSKLALPHRILNLLLIKEHSGKTSLFSELHISEVSMLICLEKSSNLISKMLKENSLLQPMTLPL